MRKQYIDIALVQTNLEWENPRKNIENLNEQIQHVNPSADLIILPEMFSTGFTMNAKSCAEKMGGTLMQWLAQTAAQKKSVLAGSLLIEENGKFYNRFIWMKPDGNFEYYDKHHLFTMVGEHKVMTRGNEQKIITLNGWKFCLQICYDLRFPVWSKNRFIDGMYTYDILIYVANWPNLRKHAYERLLPARAIENIAYLAWVNRIGVDGKGISYSGDSKVINPAGSILESAEVDQNTIIQVRISDRDLTQFRKNFQVGPDWDQHQFS